MKKLIWFVCVVMMVYLSKTYFGKAYKQTSGSMLPTIMIGERFLVNTSYFKQHSPNRGDLAVFILPKDNKTVFVKRVVGLPGETIQLKENIVYINNSIIAEPYAMLQEGKYLSYDRNYGPFEIPRDAVFVLGDNRNNSYDSRMWGPVPLNYLIGKPNRIYWSGKLRRIFGSIQ